MPKANIDIFTRDDIRNMYVIGEFVLDNFLHDAIPTERRQQLLAKLSFFNLFIGAPDEAKELYKEVLPEYCESVKDKELPLRDDENNMREAEDNHPDGHFFTPNINKYYTNKKLNEPIEYMVGALKEISDYLDEYISTAQLTEREKTIVLLFREALDDFTLKRSHINSKRNNTSFGYAISSFIAGLPTNKVTFRVEFDNEGGLIPFLDGEDEYKDWKTVYGAIKDTPIDKVYLSCYNVTKKYRDFMSNKDADRDDMIKAYEDHAVACYNMQEMSEEYFNSINVDGKVFQNVWDEFAKGSRAPIYMHSEAVARVAILKAGYPKSDMVMLSQFYMQLIRDKHLYELGTNVNGLEDYKRKLEQWNKVIAPGAITAEERIKRITELKEFCQNEPGSFYRKLTVSLNERINAELSPYELMGISGTVADYYNTLNSEELDPNHLKSSSQYKQMKEAVSKLSGIDKAKYPEQYKRQLKIAIDNTKSYIDYKKDQNRKAGSSHTRSAREEKRVNTAGAILDGLNRMEKEIYFLEHSMDDRKVIDNIEYAEAKDFTEAYEKLTFAKADLLNKLNDIKTKLQSTQQNKDSNFGNKEAKEGSKYYQTLTNAVENSIVTVTNPNSTLDAINAAFDKLNAAAKDYKKDKEGIFGAPTEGNAGIRYNSSVELVSEIPTVRYVFSDIYNAFDKCKDKYNIPFGEKSFADIEDAATTVYGKYVENFKAEPKVGNADMNSKMDKLKERAKIKGEIRTNLASLCPTVVDNYKFGAKPDYYVTLKDGLSTSELALWFTTKKMLDVINNPNVSDDKLAEYSEILKDGSFNDIVKDLSSSSTFKRIVNADPKLAFSKWDRIDSKADKLVEDCAIRMRGFLNQTYETSVYENGKYVKKTVPCGTPLMYISMGNDIFERAANYAVNYMLAVQAGRDILEKIAADDMRDPLVVINNIKADVKKFFASNNKLHPSNFLEDDEGLNKILKVMKDSYKRIAVTSILDDNVEVEADDNEIIDEDSLDNSIVSDNNEINANDNNKIIIEEEIDPVKAQVLAQLKDKNPNRTVAFLLGKVKNGSILDDNLIITNKEDEALMDVLSSLSDADRQELFDKIVSAKVVHICSLGFQANEEARRAKHNLYADNKLPTKTNYDFGEAKYNYALIDNVSMYSTKLLRAKTLEEIEWLDKLINSECFANVTNKEKAVEQGIIQETPWIISHTHASVELMHIYGVGKAVKDAKPVPHVDLALDGNKVKINSIDEDFLAEESKVHKFVEAMRKSEKIEREVLHEELKKALNANNKSILEDKTSVELLASFVTFYDSDNDMNVRLREHRIRDEVDYAKRRDYVLNRTKEIIDDPVFYAYIREHDNIKGLINDSPTKFYKDWAEYRDEFNAKISEVIKEDDDVLDFMFNTRMNIEEIREQCKRTAHAIEVVSDKGGLDNAPEVAKYFVAKMLLEPGAKRTFFGKGTDWSNEEKAKTRGKLKPDENGNYNKEEFNKAIKKMRDDLLTDKNFLKRVAKGDSLVKMYADYKKELRDRTNSISNANYMSKRRADLSKHESVTLTDEEFNYYKRTKDELDTLYKLEGKFRSKYMDKLYEDLGSIVYEAESNHLAGNGYKVNTDKVLNLQDKAVTYYKERKGRYFSKPLTDRGQARLQIVESLVHKNDDIMDRVEHPEKEVAKNNNKKVQNGGLVK